MISPDQSRDLFKLEQLRKDEYFEDIRQHVLCLSENLKEAGNPAQYCVNKLLNLLDGC